MAKRRKKNENILLEESKPKSNSRKTASAETKSTRKSKSKTAQAIDWQKNLRIGGAFLIITSIFLLLALVSFMLTGKEDLSNQNSSVENWMGRFGFKMGMLLIYDGFGLAIFCIIPLLFAIGLKWFSGKEILPLKKTALLSIFFTLWLATALGMIIDYNPFVSGYGGFSLSNEITAVIGYLGGFLLLLITFYAFLFWGFNLDLLEKFEIKTRLQSIVSRRIFNKNKAETNPKDKKLPRVDAGDTLFEKDKIDIVENIESIDIEMTSKNKEVNQNPDLSEPEFEIEIEVPKKEEIKSTFSENNKPKEHYGVDEPFDPKLELSGYIYPDTDLLNAYDDSPIIMNRDEINRSKSMIVETLRNYRIEISKIKATIGPTVSLFEIVPAPGIKISKIKSLEDDIALSLAALGIRIIAPIPGKGTIGIEVPNKAPQIVSMKSVLESNTYQNTSAELPVCLGRTISNEVYISDLAKMPHMLMAGATGQGKSVGLNAILVSLMYKKHPAELKFVLVDPKKVELSLYNVIERHFLAKLPGENDAIITENKQVVSTLNSLCIEMDNRYQLLQEAMVRNKKEYNQKFISRKLNPENGHRYLPYIVCVIDEMADLIMTAGKDVEHPIGRLAQLARAVGIHLILATQRPSVNIITGTIKANFPARMAFRVTSKIDSRTILDANGADQLIGKGDALFSDGRDLVRLQCPFVDTPEVEEIVNFIGNQRGFSSAYILPEASEDGSNGSAADEVLEDKDALFEDAAHLVVQHQQGSTSLIQRRLKIGYNRAGRLIDQLEHAGIVGPFEGSKAREVLFKDAGSLEQHLLDIM